MWLTNKPCFVLVLLLAVLLLGAGNCGSTHMKVPPAGHSYTTNFQSPPAPENPISEQSKWINGKANALDWQNVRTTAGFAFGTQTGFNGFDDSTALLTGPWGPNQTAQATIHIVAQDAGVAAEESEIRLRSSMSSSPCPGQSTGGCNTGYEINFSAVTGNNYVQIVRWNGPLGSFTMLDGRAPAVHDGDTAKATIVGNTITAYINGTQVAQATDTTYDATWCSTHPCNPGIGFYLQNSTGTGNNAHFGFSSFTVTDGAPLPPTGLSTVVK